MGAESGQPITGDTSRLGQDGLRRRRVDGSTRILDDNNEIKRRLQIYVHLNEDGHRGLRQGFSGVSYLVF